MSPPARSEAARRPRVVIVGGGFAGLQIARSLERAAVDVVVVDRQNHHLFQPLLYQVATAGLAGPDIASPIRRILRRQRNASVLYAEVTGVDAEAREVLMGDRRLPYDVLVLATGATHSYFGNDGWAEHAPGLKTLADAHEIRARVLRAFERAESAARDADRDPWLRMVVVGAGPTGVELAGALAELSRKILPRDFRNFDPKRTEVLLLEGGSRVLPAYSDELSDSAQRQLEGLGVTVRTGALVTDIDANGVSIGEDERIEARTVLWAAGVQASPLLDVPTDRAGRVVVEPDLTAPGHPEIFVLGDAAHVEIDGAEVPGVAPAAMQMGKHAARQIRRRLDGRQSEPFKYRDKGSMATIGRASAVAEIGGRQLRGLVAWLAWLFVHLLFLVDFRNRLVVLINWIWAYVGYRPVARVVAELATAEDERDDLSRQRQTAPAPPEAWRDRA
ncbi:MAG: NAD(P)/FAD-dependent oxidoreductase [Planctomycetota bacterium]